MKTIIQLIIPLLLLISCNNAIEQKPEPYLRWVGDIKENPTTDNNSFKLCNEEKKVMQYFNNGGGLEYKGEKIAIIKSFEQNYNPKIAKKESGSLRVRFIVNCKGESGRFRTLGMDNKYKRKKFDASITDQILAITKSLDGWMAKTYDDKEIEYYQYLIFKIEEGQIKEILP